jgi:septal ring factor EnvC (AmiA/AmiB activator)
MANIERKLSVLDQICSRLDKMEKNYGKVDTNMLDCKNRISNLEKSAQFLSNIHDEHKALKYKVDSINSGIETNQSDNKVVRDRLNDIEAQNLRHNLLFFALDEQLEGGATGSTGV